MANRTPDQLRTDNPIDPTAGVTTIPAMQSSTMGAVLASALANDANAIHDNVSGEIAAVTEKASPTSSDLLLIEDAAASNAKKRTTIANLPGCAMACATSRTNFTPTAATVDGNFTGIDNKLGVINTATTNQTKIVANSESVIVDNDSATPALRGDVASTWTLGEVATPWATSYVDTYSIAEASAVVLTLTSSLLQYNSAKSFEINQAAAATDAAAGNLTLRAGAAGAASAAVGKTGGAGYVYGGTGGAGSGGQVAGAGGPLTIQAGAAGANGGAGGANGGAVTINAGAATGAGANGAINIGNGTAPSSIILGAAETLVDVQGYLRLAEMSAAPAGASNKGSLYVIDDGGDTELCYEDDDGNDVQLTRDGYPNTNRGGRDLGASTFTINAADDGKVCFWTGTSTGVAGTIAAGRAYQVVTVILTGTAGTITFAGSGVTVEAARGKTLTTQAPGASTTVAVTIIYDSTGTYATVLGDLA